MSKFAIIGGSGLDRLAALEVETRHFLMTNYGAPSAPPMAGMLAGTPVIFLPRHGEQHSIPPHRINYRANIAALAMLGVTDVISVTAVGGISRQAGPGRIVIPEQIIDYTYGREHTFFDGLGSALEHVDFTAPYSPALRELLCTVAAQAKLEVIAKGVYGATQGPRLESGAEIARLARDGCTIVGMTGMPEAGLAREAGLRYANCSLVVNWAAGRGEGEISMQEIAGHLERGMHKVLALLSAALSAYGAPASG